LGGEGSGVVTSLMGRASFTIRVLMRNVRAGNLTDAAGSPVGYVPFEAFVQKDLAFEMDQLLRALTIGEIKTNVTIEEP
jgi:hypothetical protein